MSRGLSKKRELLDVQEMVKQYRSGSSIEIVADLHGIDRRVASDVLKKNGVEIRKRKYPLGMVLHDWNADKDLTKIAFTYGFKNTMTLSCWVCDQRKKGIEFKVRRRT